MAFKIVLDLLSSVSPRMMISMMIVLILLIWNLYMLKEISLRKIPSPKQSRADHSYYNHESQSRMPDGNGRDRGLMMIKNEELRSNVKEALMEWFEEHQMTIVSDVAGEEEYHCGENGDGNCDRGFLIKGKSYKRTRVGKKVVSDKLKSLTELEGLSDETEDTGGDRETFMELEGQYNETIHNQ
ncbi:hypothetical protein PPACK8108_LOCUS7568 [Phakopsora pachyrhizi]|uniref:Uncharacterized protein n=1 Tax=Phakopsora pachyrhizi TaxID=170000 RepID=A0AAV0AV74_PHAPC|nr:hypothetical protein PPACK8108_LOCUS7568 [Phakopsora pachyrhizi]